MDPTKQRKRDATLTLRTLATEVGIETEKRQPVLARAAFESLLTEVRAQWATGVSICLAHGPQVEKLGAHLISKDSSCIGKMIQAPSHALVFKKSMPSFSKLWAPE